MPSMSSRRDIDRIHDIVDAINEIFGFINDISSEEFLRKPVIIRAIELDCIIIGEAANHLSDEFMDIHSEIPWHYMRGLRNQIVLAYFNISPQILWETIHKDIYPVRKHLERIISNE